MIKLNTMVTSFIATIIAASVVLVPKTGVGEKAKVTIPQEVTSNIPAEAKVIVNSKEKKEGSIVLRKAKKPKAVKYSKNKKGKKSIAKVETRTEFDNENLDDIYKKERNYFKTGVDDDSKKRKTATVTGALASIPAAVAELIANNIALAKAARHPAPPPPPVKLKEQTAEEVLNVETTIQNTNNEAKIDNKNESKKLAFKLPPKKIIPKDFKKKEFKEIKQVEVRKELDDEVLSVGADQVKSAHVEPERSPAAIKADAKELLSRVETKYVTHFIKIKVNSEVTQTLLDRTKTYSGDLFLAPQGRIKMEIKEPNKHMLLMNGKNIWVVDYPLDETQDKVQILHSTTSAKSLKNQAFLDIFSGVGNLQKRFKIESSDKKDDEITYKLIPKKKDEQIERVELKLDSQAELITVVSFWDTLGNKTQLKFSKQEFEDKTPKDIFNFKPPKDASITNL